MYSILIAEDHESLGYVLKEYLTMNGFRITLVTNGNDALAAFEKQQYDLCLLDVMLPGCNGFEAAAEIKMQHPSVPVIFLTARALKVDKIKGFKLGADDYIVKPADEEELLLRIQSVIKRAYPPAVKTTACFSIGKIQFEPTNLVLFMGRQRIMLTEKEAHILTILAEQKGNLVPRKYILREIWNESSYFTARTMDVHLTKLRKHLAMDPEVQIVNVHGKGFVLMCQ
jgi:two-component system OmpR family response regulator